MVTSNKINSSNIAELKNVDLEHLQKPVEYNQNMLRHRICGDNKDISLVTIKMLITKKTSLKLYKLSLRWKQEHDK